MSQSLSSLLTTPRTAAIYSSMQTPLRPIVLRIDDCKEQAVYTLLSKNLAIIVERVSWERLVDFLTSNGISLDTDWIWEMFYTQFL